MKKIILTSVAITLLSVGMMAQNHARKKSTKKFTAKPSLQTANQPNSVPATSNKNTGTRYDRCGSHAPGKEWDEWFNKKVEAYKQSIDANRSSSTAAASYTIPIVFHVITYTASGTIPVGTYPNLSQAQIQSQVDVLNADYGGTGHGVSTYTALTSGGHGPFYDYATANGLPAPDNTSAGILPANTGITFCLAGIDKNGVNMPEAGIDRVNCYSFAHSGYSSSNPADASLTNPNTFSNFMDAVIKPQTIWDPTKYFNVWLTDEAANNYLLGYATFPTGTGLGGLSGGGSGTATSNTDGCWVYAKSCGNTGTLDPPYDLGRSLSHETGHYLGLRHTWGDGGQCPASTDYCNDTPPEQSATYYGSGTYSTTTQSSAITTWNYPFNSYYECANGPCTSFTNYTASCSNSGTYNSNAGDGVMYMNFMDYSDDQFMCMFTNDQLTRMITALTQCPDRVGLTNSAVTLCNLTITTPTANFTYPANMCRGVAQQFTDASNGPPSSWTWSVTPSAGVTINTATSGQSPMITFPSAGSYSVTLVTTNTVGTNSITKAVTIGSCITLSACDTLSNFSNSDTLTLSLVDNNGGYVSGTNTYGDLAKAEFYDVSALTSTKITGVICLFYKDGTQGTGGTGTTSVDIFNGDLSSGPTGSAITTATASLASIIASTATTSVNYCGTPGLAFSTAIIIPYKFTFASPILTPANGFFASLNIPTTGGDTVVVWQNTTGTTNTVSTAWEKDSDTNWYDVETDWSDSTAISFAILPILCPTAAGIEQNELGSNINLFPNPNNGQFNFAVTLPEATNLNFTIVNVLGQVVYTKSENNVTNVLLNCNLSHLAKGVYYANITDGKNNKTVKKIIIE